jgi:hypothetical protein
MSPPNVKSFYQEVHLCTRAIPLLYASLFLASCTAPSALKLNPAIPFEDRVKEICSDMESTMRSLDSKDRLNNAPYNFLEECKPFGNKLLTGGVQECISYGISKSEQQNNAESACNLLASSANKLAFNFPGGHNLPFNPTCAAMQEFLNTQKWDKSTKLSDFEGKEFNNFASVYYCSNGYVTETSPLGTLICSAFITYEPIITDGNEGKYKYTWGYGEFANRSSQGDNCRWK